MDLGWIKLCRQLLNSQIFQNESLLKVYIWCLLRANYTERWVSIRTGRGTTEVKVLPGSFVYGRKSAAKELRANPESIRVRMSKLQKMGKITIQSTTHYSLVSIVNWESMQSAECSHTTQNTKQTPTKHQPNTTDKKVKNDKKSFCPNSAEFRLAEFLLSEIQQVKPDTKKPSLQSWAKTFDLMLRLDRRKPSDIEGVIRWCQRDPFWQSVVLSPSSLRKHFDKLQLKMGGHRQQDSPQPQYLDIDELEAKRMEVI